MYMYVWMADMKSIISKLHRKRLQNITFQTLHSVLIIIIHGQEMITHKPFYDIIHYNTVLDMTQLFNLN